MKTKILLAISLLYFGTTHIGAQNTWTQKANYPGAARSSAVGFVIGNNAYIGTGTDDVIFFSDFWKYDPVLDTFIAAATFPGTARREAVAFSIGTDGFIGTGCCGAMSDFWKYNSLTDSWSQVAPFPNAMMTGIAFAINGKGYVGLGDELGPSFSQKIYEYDPVADTWTQKANFPGAGRTDALGFSMNGKGYVAIGDDGNGPFLKDLWEYNPTNDSWTQKTDFPGGHRSTAVGFAIASTGKLYIGTGDDDVNIHNDFWEWDSATDTWTQILNFPGAAETDETGFAIGNKGYVALGQVGQPPESNELWEYGPLAGINEMSDANAVSVFPNPASDILKIALTNSNEKINELKIYDQLGLLVYDQEEISPNDISVNVSEFAEGIYFVSLTFSDGEIENRKISVVR
jgi:N-acetylneuraminic acid mutarotase